MSKQGKVGQPPKNYRTTWGKTIDGLTKQPDGRWRDQRSGKRWSDANERRAVETFLKMRGIDPVAFLKVADDADASTASTTPDAPLAPINPTFVVDIEDEGEPSEKASTSVGYRVPESFIWGWLREQVENRPEVVAAQLGVSVAALRDIPRTVKLSDMLGHYKQRAASRKIEPKTLAKTVEAWGEFVNIVGVSTLDMVGSTQLLAYRTWAEDQERWSDKTRGLVYGRVKAVVGATAKAGVDVARLLALLKMLEVSDGGTATDASPMSRSDFRKLLDHPKTNAKMRALLLLALNCCMYAKEVSQLRWSEIDMNAGTMVCRRGKTKIIRAAVLWSETLDALRALPRDGEFVLLSERGAAYNVESLRKLYADHRDRCDVAASKFTEFASMRDAAYTVAAQKTSMQQTVILAGHRVGGLTDSYIARNPQFVADACKAVHAAYLG